MTMNLPPVSWQRRLAETLARHAVQVMPDALRHWAGAMETELAYVADDRSALRWAAGGVSAAYRTRLRQLCLLDVAAIRTAGVLLTLFRAFDVTLPSVMTAAYRLGALGFTDSLGRVTPGDDYRRLIPLMEAIPGWLHVMLAAAGTCYLVTAILLVARRRRAAWVLLAAVTIECSAGTLARPILASVGVTVTSNPSLVAAVLLPVVFPLVLAAAAWSGSRRDGDVLQP